ncbi:MAG: ABC transporter ATP-binding protein [Clostridia bacterium]|nr:ABC transporter ATP-binding protein [Clostridia bacterium]
MKKEKVKKEKKPKEKPKYSVSQNVMWMLRKGWKTKKSVIFLLVLLIVVRCTSHLIGVFMTPSILGVLESAAPLSKVLATMLGFLLSTLVLDCVITYIEQNTLYGRVEVRMAIVNEVNQKAMTTSYTNTVTTKKNEIINQAYNNCNSNACPTEAIWSRFREVAGHTTAFVVFLCMLSYVNPILMAVSVVTCLVEFFMNRRLNNWWYENRKEGDRYSRHIGYVTDVGRDVAYAKDLRLFGMKRWLEDIYSANLKLQQRFQLRGQVNGLKGDVLRIVLALLRNGAAYAVLILQAIENGMSASEFLLCFTVIGEFTGMFSSILGDFTGLHSQSLELSKLREMLELDEPFKFEDGEALVPDKNGSYTFTFENVSFRYPEAEKDTISGLNLTVNAGEKLAIVGLNGAGKTTLVKLMCGLFDPTEGRVLINGEDLRKYNRRDIYKHFSAVFQTFSILSVTLEENVTLQEEGINYEKLYDVIEKAGLSEKVASLEHGYKTQIGRDVYEDGVLLSGGETQRLMLARALYKDAPVILLDEPTAALDPIAENELYMKYSDMTAGRTSVYISHRLASTRFCDRIIYLEDGRIVEEGSHANLMRRGGKYKELFDIQSKYYKEGGTDNG